MPEPLLLTGTAEGVKQLTLNRPDKRNALTRELLTELLAALNDAAATPGLRLLVLAANGPAFSAGMDLVQMEETAGRPDAQEVWRADTQLYHDVVSTLFQLSVSTLAVVQGPAVAGGLGLVLACDLVLAADSAIFALPEPKRGITAAIVTPLLVYRTGASGAASLLFSGESLDARRGQQIGICQNVVASKQLETAAADSVRSILSGAPGALAISKRQLRECAAQNVSAQLAAAIAVSATARESAEAREGLAAFLQKRTPSWQAEERRQSS
jgi:methylglutaconyl-CoA hydratase